MPWSGKVVCGGQTGVDRAALDAALEAGLELGGYVPKGRLAEDGPLPPRYPMTECDSAEPAVRTELNVLHSDATLILNRGPMAGGTALTAALCRKHRKPVLVVDADAERAEETVRAFLKERSPTVLNVAGPRESKSPGIYAVARGLLRRVLG